MSGACLALDGCGHDSDDSADVTGVVGTWRENDASGPVTFESDADAMAL